MSMEITQALIALSTIPQLINALNWIYAKSPEDQLLLNGVKALLLEALHQRHLALQPASPTIH